MEQSATPRLFPILFTSFWLYVYYCSVLAASRPDAGAFSRLLRSLWFGPRDIRNCAVHHQVGHCYAIDLPEDFPCDETGRSVLILLENGRPLPHAHCKRLQDIVTQGGGRYVHARRRLYFAPSDNADLSTVGHRYDILESLTGDLSKDLTLQHLNAERHNFANPLLWALEKARVYLGQRLSYRCLEETGPCALRLSDVTLDTGILGLGVWRCDILELSWQAQGQAAGWIDLETVGLKPLAAGKTYGLKVGLHLSAEGRIRLQRLDLTSSERHLLCVTFDWAEAGLQSAELLLGNLDSWRRELTLACGGETAYHDWLQRFLSDLRSGALPLPCRLEDADAACIATAFAAEGRTAGLRLRLDLMDGRFRVRAFSGGSIAEA